MLNGATVTLAGHVAKDPSYSLINGSTPKASLRVAWTTRYRDRVTGEWRDGSTSFASVECWRYLANNVASSLRKGHAVVVTGKLRVREYEDKEGRRRTAVDIDAESIGHDLSRGVSHLLPRLRRPGDAGAEGLPQNLAGDEAVRPGQEDGEAAAGHGTDWSPAGRPDADGEGTRGDVLDTAAVTALAESAEEAVMAAAPF